MQRGWQQLWRERGEHAVSKRRADAKTQQGPHIETAIVQGGPGPREQWRAGPQYHGQREREFNARERQR